MLRLLRSWVHRKYTTTTSPPLEAGRAQPRVHLRSHEGAAAGRVGGATRGQETERTRESQTLSANPHCAAAPTKTAWDGAPCFPTPGSRGRETLPRFHLDQSHAPLTPPQNRSKPRGLRKGRPPKRATELQCECTHGVGSPQGKPRAVRRAVCGLGEQPGPISPRFR